LNASKKSILRYLADEKIRFSVDRSNRSTDFTRNRVRLELLPLLEKKYNPKTAQALASLADAAFDASEYLGEVARKAFARTARKSGRQVRVDLKKWRSLDPAIRAEVFFMAIDASLGDRKRINSAHLGELFRIAEAAESKLKAILPQGLVAERRNQALFFIT
jgi:tRNA(Ile)-lysidine synthase